jgi:hypothetical protein
LQKENAVDAKINGVLGVAQKAGYFDQRKKV